MSKLFPHILNVGSQAAKDFCIATQPGFVLCVSEFGAGAELQQLVPGLRAVGRIYSTFDANAVARSGVDAAQAARFFVEEQRETYRLNPALKIWTGPNEPIFGAADDPANVSAFAWYARFEAERVRLLAQIGLLAVVGNFNMGAPDLPGETGYHNLALFMLALMDEAERRGVRLALPSLNAGTPEYGEMLAMLDTGVFERMILGRHWLALHEGVFGLDPIEKGFGDLLPGAPFVAPGAGSLCFRYRYLLHIIKQRHRQAPAIAITEFYCGGGYEPQQTAESVLQRFAWYDRGVRSDPEVLAVCPFTPDPGSWTHQSYDYILPAMLDYLTRLKDQPNATEPAPPAEPDWPGLARVGGLVGSNLRSGPAGLVVGAAWRDKVIRIVAAHGDWLEARLFIHESRVTRL